MKKTAMWTCLMSALLFSVMFSAKSVASEVQLTVDLQNYGGDGAYLAFYVTDSKGVYQNTLWIAGTKTKYYKHLAGWAKGSGRRASEYDGLTGASVLAGKTLTVKVNIADALIDAGFQIRVDAAVEDMRDMSNEVVVQLTTEGVGLNSVGRYYVKNFKYSF